jgi:elongation factor G
VIRAARGILLWLGLKPKTGDDGVRLGLALAALTAADPSLAVKTDRDGTVRLGAESEERLDAAVERLAHASGVDAEVTGITVAYKEGLTRAAVGQAKYTRQSGGRGQYAHVKIRVRPGLQTAGYVFENVMTGGAMPVEFIAPIDAGIREARDRGVLAGYPVEDVHVTLYDGSYHEVDSSAAAFKIAGALAFLDAAKKAQPLLLEPIVNVTVIVPPEYASAAKAALVTHGYQTSQISGPRWLSISARMPLVETLGLATEVRQRTRGNGQVAIGLAGYAPAPRADDDRDRDATVTARLRPRTPLRTRSAAVPEPEDEELDDDTPFTPRGSFRPW